MGVIVAVSILVAFAAVGLFLLALICDMVGSARDNYKLNKWREANPDWWCRPNIVDCRPSGGTRPPDVTPVGREGS